MFQDVEDFRKDPENYCSHDEYGIRMPGKSQTAYKPSCLQNPSCLFIIRRAKRAGDLLAFGETKRDESLDLAKHAAWTTVASAIFNLDEVITKE